MCLGSRIKLFVLNLIFAVSLIPCSVEGQDANTAFQNSLYGIISLDTTKTDSLLVALKNSKERAYLQHYKIFLDRMVMGQLPTDYNKRLENITGIIEKDSSFDERTLAFLSEIYLQKGIMEFSADNQRTAVFSFFKAYRLWRKSKREHPRLTDNIKLTGIFNLLMCNMPQPYKKMAGWIGFTGDHAIGFNALKTYQYVNDRQLGSKQEALLYLAFSYLKFDIDEKRIENLILDASFEDLLPLTRFIVTRCAFKIRKPVLDNTWLKDSVTAGFLPLLYLRGKYKVLTLDSTGIKDLAEFSVKNTSGQFLADACRYRSWQLFLKGDTSGYMQQQNLIKQLGKYPTWEDKQARYESMLNQIPNDKLLCARLLFDAGKYQVAVDSLLKMEPKTFHTQNQQIEFQYRLGRCYHMLKQNTTAIFHYTEAIKLGDSDTRYFAPYAALYTAELHMQENPVTARFYLKEAKRLNNGEHQASVERKIELLNELLNNH